jgi:hypothetical protein
MLAQFYAFIKSIKSNLNVEEAEVCLLLFKSACKPLFSFLAFARRLPLVFSASLFIVAGASTGCLDVVEGLDVGWPPLTAFKAVTVSRWQTWQTWINLRCLFRIGLRVVLLHSLCPCPMAVFHPNTIKVPQALHTLSRRPFAAARSLSVLRAIRSVMRWAEVDGLEMARCRDEFSKKAACKPSLLFLAIPRCFSSNAS